MVGEVNGTAIVRDADDIDKKNEKDAVAKEIDFYLDIMCCDPNDTQNCKACESTELDATPIMKIGPKSNAESRFFVRTGMDTHSRKLGYFHIEKLYYEAVDETETSIAKFDLIENGCNRVGKLIEFNGEFDYFISSLATLHLSGTFDNDSRLDRQNKTEEGFYLTPFLSGDDIAEKITITAEVISCPLGVFGDRCKLGDTCDNRYPTTWYSGTSSIVTRRRRNVFENGSQSDTRTIQVYHPCHVVTEDKPFCITDENGEKDCWTNELCIDRRTTEVTTDSGAFSVFPLISAFILLML